MIAIPVAQAAAARNHLQPRMEHPREESVLECLMKVANLPKLLLDPTILYEFLKSFQFVRREIVRLQCFIGGIGRKHPGLEREMNSLQSHRIQKTGSIAHDHSPAEVILRQGPVAAFRDTLRTVGKERAALENLSYIGMRFEFLKFHVGIEPGVEIIQTDDEPNRHTSLGHVVDKSPAEFLIAQRPSHRVDDASAGVLLFRYVPHFFDTDGEHLRIAVFAQVESVDQLLGERATAAFSKNGDLCANVDAGLEVPFWPAVLVDAFVAGSNTDQRIAFD